MTENFFKNNILELKLEGFEGPIDLLLSLVRDQKVDILKIKILPLAEQYLEFLKKIIKKDIDERKIFKLIINDDEYAILTPIKFINKLFRE